MLLAYETDLLDYPDIFEGSVVMDGLVGELLEGARAEPGAGSRSAAERSRPSPYMKAALVESNRARIARIESGAQVLVGVNRFTETEPSPLIGRGRRDPGRRPGRRGRGAVSALEAWRSERGDV